MKVDNKFTKRRCLCACNHTHLLSNNVKNWDVFVSTRQQILEGPRRLSTPLSSSGNSVHVLFPQHGQDTCKSWACGGEAQPIPKCKVSVAAGANRGEEKRHRGELKAKMVQ